MIKFIKEKNGLTIVVSFIAAVVAIITGATAYIKYEVRSAINESYLLKFDELKASDVAMNDKLKAFGSLVGGISEVNDIHERLINDHINMSYNADSTSISLDFSGSKDKRLLEMYFAHLGYQVQSLQYSSNRGEIHGSKVLMAYDLTKEEISRVFSDLINSGMLDIVCVEPVRWSKDIHHVSVFSLDKREQCMTSKFSKELDKKSLSMLINTKNESYNPKYGETSYNTKKNTTAYLLNLDEFRKDLVESDTHNEKITNQLSEEVHYGK